MRGEGYEVHGPVYMLGDQKIDLGECIICEVCFAETNRRSNVERRIRVIIEAALERSISGWSASSQQ